MKTILLNLQTFITIGMAVILYFWLMSWSVKWFVNFKVTYANRKNFHKMNKKYPDKYHNRWVIEKYCWKEIVAIPVYLLTWTPVIAIIVAFIGGFFYLLYELFMSMITIVF